ncbi:MAG: hypothetical protein HC767_03075 [Akkermansiaceae bacterium]|nr:hypothetical protein [Akkermansiaceae bacterium]
MVAEAPGVLSLGCGQNNKNTGGKLVPVAIQLDASTDLVRYERKNSRVWTPDEKHPLDWMFAKLCVQVCYACSDEIGPPSVETYSFMYPYRSCASQVQGGG